ncbi:MAG: hypothetical protein ACKV2V_15370 [Blastocatellia bacterium]
MQVITYEAVVEDGQIKLPDSVRLPEKTRVYVIVPGLAAPASRYFVGSPRLVRPEQAMDFAKEVIRETKDADIQ